MAVLKHIKSKNANYSDAIDYLLFQHDENNGKKILDDSGRPILREEYYIDGLLCTPESFDKECEITNKKPPFYFAKGKGFVNGKLAVKAEFSFALIKEEK